MFKCVKDQSLEDAAADAPGVLACSELACDAAAEVMPWTWNTCPLSFTFRRIGRFGIVIS